MTLADIVAVMSGPDRVRITKGNNELFAGYLGNLVHIKQMSEEKKKKRKTAEDIAKEQNVSDTDTSEEEKANAKKLHAVKMLEKYYIYLSEEETGILERMLEDCKRRKREYALEED